MRIRRGKGLVGLICIAAGIVGLLFAMGGLIVRAAAGLLCIYCINYGLRLQGMPKVHIWLAQMAPRRWF